MSDEVGDSATGPQGRPSEQTVRERGPRGTPPPLSRAAGRVEGGALVTPLSPDELRLALLRPDLLAAHVLGSADRIALNLSAGGGVALLTVVLSAASLVATAPFGAASPVANWWNVAALYTGSLLITFPCLHVFLQFLGVRIGLVTNLALCLVITATAALFTLGFAPIIWFIDRTTRAGDGAVATASDLSRALLAVSLLMGVVQMGRCLASSPCGAGGTRSLRLPIVLWTPLLVFIVWRMAGVLGMCG